MFERNDQSNIWPSGHAWLCLGPEVRIPLRLQQLADDGGRNLLPRSICRRVVVAEKEAGVVLFLLFVQLPRQQKPQDVSDSAGRPPRD